MPRRLSLIDSSALLAQPERLRAQAAETGYLYLPGILPVDEVNALRSELLGVAAAPRCVRPLLQNRISIVVLEVRSLYLAILCQTRLAGAWQRAGRRVGT